MLALFLLLGVPAIGKTTVIDELLRLGVCNYLTPYTTRPPRPNEVGKRFVTEERFLELMESGDIILPNTLYGFRYGLSSSATKRAIHGVDPTIVDWSVRDVRKFRREISPAARTIYLYPHLRQSIRERLRMRDGTTSNSREVAIERELDEIDCGVWNEAIDSTVIVHDGGVETVVDEIVTILSASDTSPR